VKDHVVDTRDFERRFHSSPPVLLKLIFG
jgi:hypothetical protein